MIAINCEDRIITMIIHIWKYNAYLWFCFDYEDQNKYFAIEN